MAPKGLTGRPVVHESWRSDVGVRDPGKEPDLHWINVHLILGKDLHRRELPGVFRKIG